MTAPRNNIPHFRRAAARIKTREARHYLRQLCRQYRRNIATGHDETYAAIDLPVGTFELDAREADVLWVRVTAADEGALATIEDAVARQLVRVALDEPLGIHWQRAHGTP